MAYSHEKAVQVNDFLSRYVASLPGHEKPQLLFDTLGVIQEQIKEIDRLRAVIENEADWMFAHSRKLLKEMA